LLRRPSFAVYFLCSLALCITIPFSAQTTSLLLHHLGVPQKWLGPALSVGQSLEIVGLVLLPSLLSRWGMRRLMLTGATAWALGLLVLAVGKPAGLVIVSLGTHGLFICCFVIVGQVYINSQAGGEIRASAQALIAVTNALGQLGGHLLTGWVRGLSSDPFALTFGLACAIALTALALFYFGFRTESEEANGVP
jgi:MFS family permease